MALLWLVSPAGAQQVGSCGSNGCQLDMAPPIYVINNEWGNNGYGSGSITVSGPTSWSTSWDFNPPTDWIVISYPSAILGWQWGYRFSNTGFPVQLSAHTPIITTVAFDVVPDASCAPGGIGGGGSGSRVCRADVSYDLWLHTTSDAGTSDPAYEVMIWLAYSRELFSGTPAQASATLGGHHWKVIQTQGGSSPVASFLLDEPADLTGATLNITDFTDWLVNNGWVPASWWIDSVQFGTEIFKGKGRLDISHYTVAVGGSGGGDSPPPAGGPLALNAGGGAVAPFAADTNYSGGAAATNWTGPIDTSGVANPAPAPVYHSERYGAMSYVFPDLGPGQSYLVRLHFAENYFGSAGQRVFNVAINGVPVLASFDVLAAAGAAHRAHIEERIAATDAGGQLTIVFSNVVNNALINGIEILAVPSPPSMQTLTVTMAGTGVGVVTSAGVSCPPTCTGPLVSGSQITLTAAAGPGSVFAGWSGCQAVSGHDCTVTMDTDRTLTAVFELTTPPSLTLHLNGSVFHPGDTLIVTATLSPGSGPMTTDAYVVLLAPDGSVLSLLSSFQLAPGLWPIGAGFVPFAFTGEVFRHAFTGGEPAGPYAWFAELTTRGTLTPLGSVDQYSFTFVP